MFETNLNEGTKTTWYFLIGLDSVERCIKHANTPLPKATTKRLGDSVVRHLSVSQWESVGADGSRTVTSYTRDVAGEIPLRIDVAYPQGGPEYGYLLDHGAHFAGQVMPAWLNVSGCDRIAVNDDAEAERWRTLPWPQPTPLFA